MLKTDVPELIVMLTHHDLTVKNATEVFAKCKDSDARCFGMKEQPLPPTEMQMLFGQMKDCGKTTFLEVVGLTEEEGLNGAEMALNCGCDYLLGTIFSDKVNEFCLRHDIRYMPFVGEVSGRPSVLEGNIEDMIRQAETYKQCGVAGIDLLGYRYKGDALALNRQLVEQLQLPVCLAGSIDSYQRLDEVKSVQPWAFTIGSAFFNHCFGEQVGEQIDKVCRYMRS
ncbi:MAG: hypothetical protein MJZ82_04535 [Paludibacteraceae bacterium]|nr:hypothetical protein [Paludibacteraceae bacterium]